MMHRFLSCCSLLLLLLTPAIADHHEGQAWLDLQNCEVCQCMGEHMDVMQHVTWETHKIANGSLSASVIPKEHRALMNRLHHQMEAKAKEIQSGTSMKLCGFCDAWSKLKHAGAKEQHIETEFGMIGMLTSDDPELVKQIHAHADRTIKEFEAMKAMMEHGTSGE